MGRVGNWLVLSITPILTFSHQGGRDKRRMSIHAIYHDIALLEHRDGNGVEFR